MIKCPMCLEMLAEGTPKCRKCQTDLALLAEYVTNLREGLGQAEAATRAGELGEAVWAYLAVLEVDPDNTTARRQVGKVVTAVRQFDRDAQGRRQRNDFQKQSGVGWFSGSEGGEAGLWSWLMAGLLLLASVTMAYYWGVYTGRQMERPPMPLAEEDVNKKEENLKAKGAVPRDKTEDFKKRPATLGGKE